MGVRSEEVDTQLPWCHLLTVHAERNTNPDGQPRIFLNQPELPPLHEQLQQVMGRELANFIVAYRQYGPATTSATPLVTLDTVDLSAPARYSLSSPLDLIDAKVSIPSGSGGKPKTYASPLTEQRGSDRERLLQLLDYATTLPRPILRGRINVNLASSSVLQAVPGLEKRIADRIVASRRRDAESSRDAERRHPVWLWFERIVDLQQMKTLFPYLTCGGDVYRAQIVGSFDQPGPTARTEVVVDATQRPPRVLYAKDLRILGRGFPDEVLGKASHLRRDAVSPKNLPFSDLDGGEAPTDNMRTVMTEAPLLPSGRTRGGSTDADTGF